MPAVSIFHPFYIGKDKKNAFFKKKLNVQCSMFNIFITFALAKLH